MQQSAGEWMEVVTKRKTGRTGGYADQGSIKVILGKWKNGKSSEFKNILSITIGSNLMKQARWVIGDYVKVLVNPEANRALIKRVTADNGWRLCGGGKAREELKALDGTHSRANVKITLQTAQAVVSFFSVKNEYTPSFTEVTEQGIEFSTK